MGGWSAGGRGEGGRLTVVVRDRRVVEVGGRVEYRVREGGGWWGVRGVGLCGCGKSAGGGSVSVVARYILIVQF